MTACHRRLVGGGRIPPNLAGTVKRSAERGSWYPVFPGHGRHGHLVRQLLADGGELLLGETPGPSQLDALRPGSVQPRPSSLSEKYKPSSSFVIFDQTVAEALH